MPTVRIVRIVRIANFVPPTSGGWRTALNALGAGRRPGHGPSSSAGRQGLREDDEPGWA